MGAMPPRARVVTIVVGGRCRRGLHDLGLARVRQRADRPYYEEHGYYDANYYADYGAGVQLAVISFGEEVEVRVVRWGHL